MKEYKYVEMKYEAKGVLFHCILNQKKLSRSTQKRDILIPDLFRL